MEYTPREVMEFVEQEDVKFIRLAFCNVYGKQHNVAIMPGKYPTVRRSASIFKNFLFNFMFLWLSGRCTG